MTIFRQRITQALTTFTHFHFTINSSLEHPKKTTSNINTKIC